MGWKDLGSFIKSIIISILIVTLAFLPIFEGWDEHCEQALNVGGPNKPYCITMIFSFLFSPGFIPAAILSGIDENIGIGFIIWMGIFSFIFYVLIINLIFWVYKKIKSRKEIQ